MHGLAGAVLDGWEIAGATFSEGGTPVFPTSESLSSVLFQSSGPRSAIPLTTAQLGTYQALVASATGGNTTISTSPYLINIPAEFTGTVTTAGGAYQYFNPIGYGSIFDSTTGTCYNLASNTEANNTVNCQFNGNNAAYLRGPRLNWTNLQVSRQVHLTERINSKWTVQAFNVFNHPNLANPSLTGAVFIPQPKGLDQLNSSITGGGGAVSSMAGFNNSLLGNQNGGDANPRMLALQIEVIF